MGTTGHILWEAVAELLHLGAVTATAAVMVGIMCDTLCEYRAEAQVDQVQGMPLTLRWVLLLL